MELGFRLFGLPVRISLYFVIIGFLVRPHEAQQSPGLTAVWLVVMFVGVLLHELGHALAARGFGQQPAILLHGMGGVTYWATRGELGPGRHLLISAAGPATGVALGLVIGVLQFLLTPSGTVGHVILGFVVWVNLGWGILNLLPFLPLDGGQILASFLEILGFQNGRRMVHWLSLVMALVLALFSALKLYIFGVILGGLMAYTNYVALRPPPPPPPPPEPAPPL